jgi:hypothetical protein
LGAVITIDAMKSLADQIGHQLGVPSVSMTFEEASAHVEDASESIPGRLSGCPQGFQSMASWTTRRTNSSSMCSRENHLR